MIDKFVQAYSATPVLGRYAPAMLQDDEDDFGSTASSSSATQAGSNGGYHAAIPRFELPNVNNVIAHRCCVAVES